MLGAGMKPFDGLVSRLFLLTAAAYAQDVRVGGEARLGAHVADLQWLGQDKSVVLLQTTQGHLQRSTDGGETWTDIRNKMNRSATPSIPGFFSPNAPIRRVFRSPGDANTVFAQGAGDDSFFSTDAGLTWERIDLQAKVQGFAFHSMRQRWALLSHWTKGCLHIKSNEPCSHNLLLTKDLGKTFSLVCSHVVQFSWGKEQFKQSDRVYFTHFRDKTSSQQRLTRWMFGIDFGYTDDFGHKVETLIPEGNKFQLSYEYILVVKVTNPSNQNVSLMISSDGASGFDPAKLPHRLWQHSFSLLDASEGALVLHVNQGVDLGDIYISDRGGKQFTLSLSRNLRSAGLCAFEKVMNLDGIYIANIFEKYAETGRTTKNEEPEDVEASSTGTQLDAMRSLRYRRLEEAAAGEAKLGPLAPAAPEGLAEGAQAERLRAERAGRAGRPSPGAGPRRLTAASGDHVRTVISFDAGGAWSYLKPPKIDYHGKDIKCDPANCWLHLHDFTEIPNFAPVYSYRNAVGIIMANGNVGPYLSTKKEDANTYLSRDGGLTWSEVHKGSFIYEFGNHGGLLVMADMAKPTKEALFSWDEGSTWRNFQISDKPVRVNNVIIEPDAMATKFLLYGDRDRVGIAKLIDFSSVHKRTCHGAAAAGTSDSDYEKWNVPCILGRQGVYTRRKQQSQCFNNETTERYRSRRPCACQQSSYECEIGFSRKVGSMDCHLESPRFGLLPKSAAADCPANGQYRVKAYRKVPGDACQGGWEPKDVFFTCTPPAGQQSAIVDERHEGSSLPFKTFLVIGTVAAGMCLARSERFHGWVKGLRDSVLDAHTPGQAREWGGTQIGHSNAASSEMAGLGSSSVGTYRPLEL
mmetsp:Transcript_105106/g.307137  ORF Transcript_105106/g.307137 Transcript_105106/m.307137 type:complete len:859 (-) Transcript_105106:22-2598(-)